MDSARLGRLAIASLHAELALAPKPGLVTPFDSGSHHDMDAGTFLRSLFALRHYFTAVAYHGAAGADFDALRRCGIAAEIAMLRATAGVNTHRGAVFSLGLLVAAAAACRSRLGHAATGEQVCEDVCRWSAELADAPLDANSPGQRARARHGTACRVCANKRPPATRCCARWHCLPCATRWPATCHARPRCARPWCS